MKCRVDAAKYAEHLMGWGSEKPAGEAWHFGFQELRELMDFIYEGPPAKYEERLFSGRGVAGISRPLDPSEWSEASPDIYRDVLLDELGCKTAISGMIPISPEERAMLADKGMGEWADKYCSVIEGNDQ